MIDPVILPQQFGGARVQRIDMVGNGDEQRAVHQDGRRFDHRHGGAALARHIADLVDPLLGELADIARVDLFQRAVALAGEVAGKAGPTVDRRLADQLGVQIHRAGDGDTQHQGGGGGTEKGRQLHVPNLHFKVSR